MKHIWHKFESVECDWFTKQHWLISGTNIILPFRTQTRYHGFSQPTNKDSLNICSQSLLTTLQLWKRVMSTLGLWINKLQRKVKSRVHCAEQKIGHAVGPEPFRAGSKGGWGHPCGSPQWVTSERGCFAPLAPLGARHPCAVLIFTCYWYETYFHRPKMRLLGWVKSRKES